MGLKERVEPMEAQGKVVYEDGDTNVPEEEFPTDVLGEAREHATGNVQDLEKQAVPSDSMCPYCGGTPTDESVIEHRLSANGYLHDDIHMQCQDCSNEWPCGVPIGEIDDDYSADLYCDSCEKRYMRIHRVAPDWGAPGGRERVLLHLKCPNCFFFDKVIRDCGDRGVALVGYPDITGSRENAKPYGWSGDNE